MACSPVRAAPSLLVCPFLPPAAAVYVEHRFGLGIREGCEVDLDGDFALAFLPGQRQVGLLPVVGVVIEGLDLTEALRQGEQIHINEIEPCRAVVLAARNLND